MSKPVNQTINAPVVGDVSGGVVHVSNTTHNHHQHDHTHHHNHAAAVHAHGPVHLHTTVVQQEPPFSLQAPPAPPARQGRRTKAPARDITPAQRDALALMRPLPKPVRVDVLIWMRIEFGTSLVMDLDPRELQRLRVHLAGVRLARADL